MKFDDSDKDYFLHDFDKEENTDGGNHPSQPSLPEHGGEPVRAGRLRHTLTSQAARSRRASPRGNADTAADG